jgi:subtilase family serine protease
MTGGTYSLTGGFWSLISVVQTAGAPTLYISHNGNAVTVSWQNTGSWTLQQNANLASANGWTANTGWTTSNGTNSLTINNPAGNLFFRLKQ